MEFLDEVTRVNAPSTVNRRRLHGSVAHQLAIMIIGGRLAPGEVLPNEDALSAAMSVSRTAYREGMRTLVAKGLVSARPKVGTTVNPRSAWNLLDPDVLSWYFEVDPNPEFIRSQFELRRIIEPAAARLAAERHDESDAERLHEALAAMSRDPSSGSVSLESDIAFHHAILAAARNDALLVLSSVIESTLRWSVRLKIIAKPGLYEQTLDDHARVLDAILARDGERAFSTLEQLVEVALEETLEALADRRA